MFDTSKITSVEYYTTELRRQIEEHLRLQSTDKALKYYDNESGALGIWWTNRANNNELNIRPDSIIDTSVLVNLANGIDPVTGDSLIQNSSGKKTNRLAGYDNTFSAPKSVSALWAAADDDGRIAIEKAHDDAVKKSLAYINDAGFIETRRGKGGSRREAPKTVVSAIFKHHTSRAGDPQLHSHCILLNVCVREDGTTGTLDNALIMDNKMAIGAFYRAELARNLQNAIGCNIVRDDKAFEIAGVPEDLIEKWSKRRVSIEQEIKDAGLLEGSKADTEKEAVAGVTASAKQVASYATRVKKDEVKRLDELEEIWKQELAEVGYTYEEIKERIARSKEIFDDQKLSQDVIVEELILRAIAEKLDTDATIAKQDLLAVAFQACQGVCEPRKALTIISNLIESRELIELGTNSKNQFCYVTPYYFNLEREMIRDAKSRLNEREFVSQEVVERVLKTKETMSDEQADAVRHALNRDGVSIVQGSAGSGKSFSLGTVAEIARAEGKNVWVTAPSWKAVSVVAEDTKTPESNALALTGLLLALEKGEVKWDKDSIVLLDEAGMVGTSAMVGILRYAKEAGAKLVLSGDVRQLQSVQAGSALRAIDGQIGNSQIAKIRRQSVDWMRRASENFAKGNAADALQMYYDAGKIAFANDLPDAVSTLTRDYINDLIANPSESRLIVTTKNATVYQINASVRAELRAMGELADDVVSVKTINRRGENVEMGLAKGDRIIFGETVEFDNVTINNSDLATVENVWVKDDVAFMTVKLDKGETVSAPISSFIGKRPNNVSAEDKVSLKVQHGYAITVHSSQGTTVDKTFVLNDTAQTSENIYVAMTRHRKDCKLYCDGKRLFENNESFHLAQKGYVLDVNRPGENIIGAIFDKEFRVACLDQLKGESEKKNDKLNVIDFFDKEFICSKNSGRMLKNKLHNVDFANLYLAGSDALPIDYRENLTATLDELAKREEENKKVPIDEIVHNAVKKGVGFYDYDSPQTTKDDRKKLVEDVVSKDVEKELLNTMVNAEYKKCEEALKALNLSEKDFDKAEELISFLKAHNFQNIDWWMDYYGNQPYFKDIVPKIQLVINAIVSPEIPKKLPQQDIRQNVTAAIEEKKAENISAVSIPSPVAIKPGKINPLKAFTKPPVVNDIPRVQPKPENVSKTVEDAFMKKIEKVKNGVRDNYKNRTRDESLALAQRFIANIDLKKYMLSVGFKESRGMLVRDEASFNLLKDEAGHYVIEANGKKGNIVTFVKEFQKIPDFTKHMLALEKMPELQTPRGDALDVIVERGLLEKKAKTIAYANELYGKAIAVPESGSRYLREIGIDADVVKRFPEIKIEQNGKNPFGITVPHFIDDKLVGLERHGFKHYEPSPVEGTDIDTSRQRIMPVNTVTGVTAVTKLGDKEPATIYVGNSVTDLLAKFQIDGKPEKAMLCSVTGRPTPEALGEIEKLAMENPYCKFVFTFNGGKADDYVKQFKSVIERYYDRVEVSRPSSEYYDFVDVLNNRKKPEYATQAEMDAYRKKDLAEIELYNRFKATFDKPAVVSEAKPHQNTFKQNIIAEEDFERENLDNLVPELPKFKKHVPPPKEPHPDDVLSPEQEKMIDAYTDQIRANAHNKLFAEMREAQEKTKKMLEEQQQKDKGLTR